MLVVFFLFFEFFRCKNCMKSKRNYFVLKCKYISDILNINVFMIFYFK